ncbi:MAG TPA: hypothetical protein DIS88_09685 [Prevotella sp.]|nr:hypothetical protein [Prevotella sp.]
MQKINKPVQVQPLSKVLTHLTIGFVIIAIFSLLPAPEPLTHYGMIVIGLFIAANLWFASLNMIWTSMLTLILYAILTKTPSAKFITAIFGNATIWQVIIMMALCFVVKESGCAVVIAKKMLAHKLFSGRPMLFSYMMLLVAAVLGFLTSAAEGAVLTFTLLDGVADAVQLDKKSPYFSVMLILSFISTQLGLSTFPYRSYLPSMVSSYEKIAGTPLNAPLYLVVTIIFVLVMDLLCLLAVKYILHIDMRAVANVDPTALYKEESEKHITKQGKAALIMLAVLIAGTMYPSFIKVGALSKLLSTTLGNNLYFALIFVLACIIRVEGKPIIDSPERVVRTGNSWSLLFSMALMMYFAGILSGKDAGLRPFLQQVVGSWFSEMSSVFFLVCIVIITTIVTGFFSNMATGIIMMTITVPLASQFGMKEGVLGMIILWSSMFGFLTPGASGATPLLFGNENLDSKTIYKYIPTFMIIFMLLCVILGLALNMVL